MTAEGTGAAYYNRSGAGYAATRRPDARISAAINRALGDARTVLNVGAGAGSYEPDGRTVVALEPSPAMIAQRPPGGASCVRGVAEALPFASRSFDAAMAVLTIHHWSDWRAGLAELKRVAGRSVVLTYDTEVEPHFWLFEYFPGILERDHERMPPLTGVCHALEGVALPLPIPHDCGDGFLGAYWRTPEAYLDAGRRARMSGFALLSSAELQEGLATLSQAIASGDWDARHGHLRGLGELDLGYRLVVSR